VDGAAAKELGTLYRVALAVQRAVRREMSSPLRSTVVGMGATGSPTEQLDRVAEAEILRCLDAEPVDWNVVSEEVGRVERGGSRTLVVDPIDGTSNALRRLPFCSVSLALGSETLAGVDLGLVRDLVRGTTWWAARGEGAFRDGRPIRARPWTRGREVLLVNLGHGASERCSRAAAAAERVRSFGCASLEIALVAEGAADGYLFESAGARNLRPTDIAAAYRILLEAGGGASSADGTTLEGLALDVGSRTTVLAWGDATFGRSVRGETP
jgi:fructose-1,6-bisphosphatase/inositol monophosphatase family enzyme